MVELLEIAEADTDLARIDAELVGEPLLEVARREDAEIGSGDGLLQRFHGFIESIGRFHHVGRLAGPLFRAAHRWWRLQGAQVGDHVPDLPFAELLAERGHAADAAPAADDVGDHRVGSGALETRVVQRRRHHHEFPLARERDAGATALATAILAVAALAVLLVEGLAPGRITPLCHFRKYRRGLGAPAADVLENGTHLGITERFEGGHNPAGAAVADGLGDVFVTELRQDLVGERQANAALAFALVAGTAVLFVESLAVRGSQCRLRRDQGQNQQPSLHGFATPAMRSCAASARSPCS